MKVTPIAHTQFHATLAEHLTGWSTDAAGGAALAEFAGRACYESWDKPNPKTATNAGYLAHILEVGHLSVLEHGSVTFYIQGVSRSLTHELVRHRHFSYSQLSQRYVDAADTEFILPPLAQGDEVAEDILTMALEDVRARYTELVNHWTAELPDAKRKEIRQAARAVLPNATETKIVVTGNFRAWRHFIDLRATAAADVEIRTLAVECLRYLQTTAPAVFSDYEITTLADGTEAAASGRAEVS